MNEPLQRITGTEVEYGFLGKSLIADDANAPLRQIHSYLHPSIYLAGQYLSNGARAYIDTGHHPEYATPECLDTADTVESEIAGEMIMAKAIGSMAANGLIAKKFRLHKRVLDSSRNACGAHQNYATSPEVNPDNSYTSRALATHFVTSAVFFGAGHFDGEKWYVSQKFTVLNEETYPTSHTEGHRPIVDTRDEPHADPERWKRLHVTSSDANISPWAMQIKLASTSMFVRLLEEGVRLDDLLLASPVAASRMVAVDTDLSKPLELANGKKMTALEIQTELARRVRKLSNEVEFSNADLEDLYEWEQACDDAWMDPMLLEDRADWVQKMIITPQLAERRGGSDPINMRIRAFDQLYDLVAPKDGIGIQQRKKGVFRCTPDEAAIEDAMFMPPDNTRAWLRGSLIVACARRGNIANLNWQESQTTDGWKFNWGDPYLAHDPKLDELLDVYRSGS